MAKRVRKPKLWDGIDQEEGIKRLCEYWYRADLMHHNMHIVMHFYDNDLQALRRSDGFWEFKTYLDYWLAGLYVVFEGMNKLKLRDEGIKRLHNPNIGLLKKFRDGTYHLSRKTEPVSMDWAEELHEALGDFLRERIEEVAALERHLKKQARYRARKKKQKEKKKALRGKPRGN
jgi:hypothetical protein